MANDDEFAKCVQIREYQVLDLPGYKEWSTKKLDDGASDELLSELGKSSIWVFSQEVPKMSEVDYEEMYECHKMGIERTKKAKARAEKYK